MSRKTALMYAVVVGALGLWAALSQDYLPVGLLLLTGCIALLHLTGPGRFGSRAEETQVREQVKNRYGVNAPDYGPS